MSRLTLLISLALGLQVGCPSSFVAIEGATPCSIEDDCSGLGDGVGCFLPAGQESGFCVAFCGDGVLRQDVDRDGTPDPSDPAYEQCDDGNDFDDDACTNNCRFAACGDGLKRTDLAEDHADYEGCDDGNEIDSDACLSNCALARCGDGVLRQLAAGEALGDREDCDDGNSVSGDGCTNCLPTLDFVLIQGGTYNMGTDGAIFGDEAPIHEVTISNFYLSKQEVTVALYQMCIDARACPEPSAMTTHAGSEILEDCNFGQPGRALHPMNCITLPEIDDFRAWRENTYQQVARLPTEAEWEFAARSRGQDRLNPWGDSEADCDVAIVDNGCGLRSTEAVCSRPQGNSEQGICDLIGNVWEWTTDRYHGSYIDAPSDGSAWTQGTSSLRIMRGGSWMDDDQRFLRSAVRMGINPLPLKDGQPFDLALPIIGFRLVLEAL
jgi:formylglycine-generating enzyme required for sulfatase activity